MANNIEIIDGFTVFAPNPIDKRFVYTTLANMQASNALYRYWGMVVSITEDPTSSNNTLWMLKKGHVDNDISNNSNFVKLSASGGFNSTYSFSNGISESSGNVKLGGSLTEDTTITSGVYGLDVLFNNTFSSSDIYGVSTSAIIGSTSALTFNKDAVSNISFLTIDNSHAISINALNNISAIQGILNYEGSGALLAGSISAITAGMVFASGSTGNISNIKQLRIQAAKNNGYSGVISNYYSLFIEEIPNTLSISNRYAIYQASATENNLFNGAMIFPNLTTCSTTGYDLLVWHNSDSKVSLADSSFAYNGLTYTAGVGIKLGGELIENTALTGNFSLSKTIEVDLKDELLPTSLNISSTILNTDIALATISSNLLSFSTSLLVQNAENIFSTKYISPFFSHLTMDSLENISNEDGILGAGIFKTTFTASNTGVAKMFKNVSILIDNQSSAEFNLPIIQMYIGDIPSALGPSVDRYGILQAGTGMKNRFAGEMIFQADTTIQGDLIMEETSSNITLPYGLLSSSSDNVVTNKIKVVINSTDYYILATTSSS